MVKQNNYLYEEMEIWESSSFLIPCLIQQEKIQGDSKTIFQYSLGVHLYIRYKT